MTRAHTKQFQEALTALLARIWDDTKPFDVGKLWTTLWRLNALFCKPTSAPLQLSKLNSAPISSLELVPARLSSI
ncbi:hypothetical protein J1N35_019324 [Gossypium stocksii]|uniref:Uncharacterized protein n=1 Tax=Gossypium stocksii TaxID=47602 RepID=A0A9D3VRY3_9ROSI|nr:hypothetical protein J1N35_019324 [Gossypium stocksii]